MILISLITGVDTVKHHWLPIHVISWHNRFHRRSVTDCRIPGTMGFHIIFSNQIKSILITQLIKRWRIRIMTGTDCIDIVLFHHHNILKQFLFWNHPACLRTKFMAVDSLKYNAFSIEAHQSVFHLKTTESYFLGNNFTDHPICFTKF